MTSVTYTASEGYMFPATSDLYTTTNGIKVERTSNTVVTVSGTPTGAANITIPDAVLAPTHDFTYSASGATITATCTAASCPLTSNPTLTISAPTLTTYGETGKSEAATLTGWEDFNTATGLTVAANSIQYFKATKSGDTYTKDGTALAAASANAGDYIAEITVSGVKTGAESNGDVTASVGYTIAPATIASVSVTDITAPTATETLDNC